METVFLIFNLGKVGSYSLLLLDITPPEEFGDTAGILHVLRLPSLFALYTHNKAIYIYGIRRTMHSLHLSELRIPPLGCKEFTGNNDLF